MTGNLGQSGSERERKRIHICFVIDNLAVGGTEKYVLRLIDMLDKSEFAPSLCLLDGNARVSRDLEPTGVPILRLGVKSLFSFRAVNGVRRLAAFCRENRIDILQSHFADSTYLGIVAAKFGGVPRFIKTRRDLVYWITKKQRAIGKRLDRLFNRYLVSGFIVNSQACQKALQRDEPVPETKSIRLIYNGVDVQKFKDGSDSLTDLIDQPIWTVGILSKLRHEKRVDVFVRAAKIVAGEFPEVRFVIGGDGPCEDGIRNLISECGLQDRIVMAGQVKDPSCFLRQIQIAVLSSSTEGCPNAVLEYMASGRAIVATSAGGTQELVDDGRTAMLVPPDQPERLATAIAELLRDRGRAVRLAVEAQSDVQARFDHVKAVEMHQEFYREMASSPASQGAN